MITNNLPLVDWGIGTAVLVVFLAVSAILIVIVLNLMKSDKKKDD
jgi:ABC-type spermidine/putrescine transport system permease subunit I